MQVNRKKEKGSRRKRPTYTNIGDSVLKVHIKHNNKHIWVLVTDYDDSTGVVKGVMDSNNAIRIELTFNENEILEAEQLDFEQQI